MGRLVLFDVNQTLIHDSKDISEYISESIRNIYGVIVRVNLDDYEGLTSKEAVRRILEKENTPEKEIEEKLDRYIEDLPYTYYNVSPSYDKPIFMKGARELLNSLRKKDVPLGIACGEPKRVIEMKFDKVGLRDYFSFGAYGNVNINPAEIVKEAILTARSERNFVGDDIFLVSSSPQFIRAAKENDITAIGVASGRFGEKELLGANADIIAGNLKDGKITKTLLK